MNKYEYVAQCRQNRELGFWSDVEAMDRIIDKWTEENGGTMNQEEIADMIDYIESIEWWSMGSLMHGYFFGAATDNDEELKGERIAKRRRN